MSCTLTVNEALALLEDCLEGKEGDNVNIYLDSPWCQVHADEDIADEDGAVDSQSGNQLQVPCAVTITTARCGIKTLLAESESKDEEYHCQVWYKDFTRRK